MSDLERDLLEEFRAHIGNKVYTETIRYSQNISHQMKTQDQVHHNLQDVDSIILNIKQALQEKYRHVINSPFKINSLALNSDCSTLIYGTTHGNVVILDLHTKSVTHEAAIAESSISTLILSASEKFIIVCGAFNNIRIYEYPSLMLYSCLEGHTDIVSKIVQGNNGTLYSCGEDGTVRAWNLNEGSGGDVIMRHNGKAKALALSSDFRYLFSGGEDKVIRVYDLRKDMEIGQLQGHENWIWALAVAGNNEMLASGSSDNKVKVWKLDTFECCFTFVGHSKRISSLSFSKDCKVVVSASTDNLIKVWPLQAKSNPKTLTGHTDWVKSIVLTPDSSIIYSASEDKTIRIWNMPETSNTNRLSQHSNIIRSIQVLPNSNHILSAGDDGEIQLWDKPKSSFKALVEGEKAINCCVQSKKGDWVAAGTIEGCIITVNLRKDSAVNKVQAHHGTIKAITFNIPGTLLMSGGSDAKVLIWNFPSMKLKCSLSGHSNWIYSLCFSSNSAYAISGSSDNTIKIWDINTKSSISTLTGHDSRINHLLLSENNEHLISGDFKGQIFIWNLYHKSIETRFTLHNESICGLYLSSDGNNLISADVGGNMVFWDFIHRQYITSIQLPGITCFALPFSETLIYYNQGSDLYFLRNPLLKDKFAMYGPDNNEGKFVKYLYEIMIEKRIPEHDADMDSWLIVPYKFNILHIYAYYAMTDHLKLSLRNRFNMINSRHNETPVSISLYKGDDESVEVMIEALCEEAKKNKFVVSVIESCIYLLNQEGFKSLAHLYQAMIRQVKEESLPRFVTGCRNFPLISLSSERNIDPTKFKASSKSERNSESVIYKESTIQLNWSAGSQSSNELLDSIYTCPNEEIFLSPYIQSIISYKWKKARYYMFCQAFLYFLYLLLLGQHIIMLDSSSSLIITIFSLNSLLLLFELFQMIVSGKNYWQDVWNYIDILRSSTCFIYLLYIIIEVNSHSQLCTVVILSSCIRGLSYFRVVKQGRFLMKIAGEILKDLRTYLILTFYGILSLSLVVCLYEDKLDLISMNVFKSLEISYGRFEGMGESMGVLVLMFVMIFNPILLQNLVISMVTDTFDRVKARETIDDLKEMCRVIRETEALMFWRRNSGSRKFLHICSKSHLEESRHDEWEGSFRWLDKKLNSLSHTTQDLNSNLSRSYSSLEKLISQLNLNIQSLTTELQEVKSKIN